MIFSLDIGNSKVVALVGSVGEETAIHGISSYYFTSNSKGNDFAGVQNGVICDLELIGRIVNQTLNEAKIDADCSIGSVIVNIAGSKVCSLYSMADIALDNQAVSVDNIQSLIDKACNKTLPDNYELLDYEVQEYLLDGENSVINPINLSAKKISSNVNLFLSNNSQITNLKNVIRYSGFGLAKIVPSGILSGMSVLNHEEKELGCCLLDIGAGTTDIVVYENGFIRYLHSIPLGGEDITRDIASVLKISRNLAEDVKLNYGGCSYVSNSQKFSEGISIADHRGVTTSISRKLLNDVITERLKDIFDVVKTGLSRQKIYDIINSGIVITGGVALLPNIEEFARAYFNMPIRIGVPECSGDFSEILTTPKHATSLGVFAFTKEYMLNDGGVANSFVSKGAGIKHVMRKFKKLFF